MKTVVHLTSAHPRDDARIFLKQCCSLSLAGYDVHLVVADGFGANSSSSVTLHDVGKSRTRLGRIFFSTFKVFWVGWRLKAELYHLHDPELLPIGFLFKILGRRVIFDSHEDVAVQLLSKHYIPLWLRKIVSFFYVFLERRVLVRFDGLIAATPTIAEKLSCLCYNTIELRNYPIMSEFGWKTDWSLKVKEICYVGAISRNRGAVELVKAINQTVPKIKLHLVGGFVEHDLAFELKNIEGWSSVIVHGRLDRKGVAKILNKTMIGMAVLHPTESYIDALPVKVFEYMAAGMPVIVSNFPILEAIVRKYKCGVVVNPHNVQDIASAINELVDDPETAIQMGENGREAIRKQLNWCNEKKKLIAFYEKILN